MAGNAAKRILKSTLDEVPLWKRKIPRYPLYYMGDPRHRVYLPQFWMKMVKPKYEIPDNRVHFIVHPQMSRMDIKQYLEKIYDVKVAEVRTTTRKGTFTIPRQDNQVGNFFHRNLPMDKYAFVTLAEGFFKYRDWFGTDNVQTEQMKEEQMAEDHNTKLEKRMLNQSKAGVPPWFWR